MRYMDDKRAKEDKVFEHEADEDPRRPQRKTGDRGLLPGNLGDLGIKQSSTPSGVLLLRCAVRETGRLIFALRHIAPRR